jgi:hypothetical protein
MKQLTKASEHDAQKFDHAKRIRELLDQAVKDGHDEDEILELVTGEPE